MLQMLVFLENRGSVHDIFYPNVRVLTANIDKWNIYIYTHRSGTYFLLLTEYIVSSLFELPLIHISDSHLV